MVVFLCCLVKLDGRSPICPCAIVLIAYVSFFPSSFLYEEEEEDEDDDDEDNGLRDFWNAPGLAKDARSR